MKITFKNQVSKFQTGGTMPVGAPEESPAMSEQAAAEQPAPQEQPEQDPIMMLAQMAAQALQTQDCQMMAQVCQAFLEIVQQMQGGAPEEPQAEPVFKKGGTLVRRIKK